MIEALLASAAPLDAQPDPARAAGGGALPAPPPADVVRFENALKGDRGERGERGERAVEFDPEAPRSMAPAAPGDPSGLVAADGSSAKGIPTLGDRVLDSLQSMSSEFKHALETPVFNAADGSPRLGVGQMLELQRSLIAVSINIDLTTKVVSKAGQSVDQLVRTQ